MGNSQRHEGGLHSFYRLFRVDHFSGSIFFGKIESLTSFILIHFYPSISGLFLISQTSYVVCCAIWCYSYNIKNVKNTHRGVLIFSKVAG